MIIQLQKNNAYFEQMIHEKRIKKTVLEGQMAKIRGQSDSNGKKTGPSFSLASIADSLSKSQSVEKINNMTHNDYEIGRAHV